MNTSGLQLSQAPVASTCMLIRKPVSEVFEAFIDPAVTTQFWFTWGSGRLEPEKTIQWEWGMYGFTIDVKVLEIQPNQRILIEWPGYGTPTLVEWIFTPRADHTTFVRVTNSGFSGEADEMVKQALDSTGGFSFVLSGLKAYLEHGIRLNLVGDHSPDAPLSTDSK